MSIQIHAQDHLTVGDLKKILANLEDKDHMVVMIAIGDEASFLSRVLTKVHEPVWLSRFKNEGTLRSHEDAPLGAERTVVLQGQAL